MGYSVNVSPHSPVAVVSIEKTLYICNEEDESVEVCVVVSNSAMECHLSFSFDVGIYTGFDSAG